MPISKEYATEQMDVRFEYDRDRTDNEPPPGQLAKIIHVSFEHSSQGSGLTVRIEDVTPSSGQLDQDAPEIIANFLKDGTIPSRSETFLPSPDDPFGQLKRDDVLTHLDLDIFGPTLFLFDSNIENFFFFTEPVFWADDKGKLPNKKHGRFYKMIGSSIDGNRFILSAAGSAEHKKEFRKNGKEVKYFYFLRGAFIDIYNADLSTPVNEILMTPIIFDPKTQDPGFGIP